MNPSSPVDTESLPPGHAAVPLIALLRRAPRGGADAAELQAVRQAYLMTLDQLASKLSRFITSLPPEVVQRSAASTVRAQKDLAVLRNAAMRSTSAEALLVTIHRAEASLRAHREGVLVDLGPTPISGVNLICRLLDGVPSGEFTWEGLEEALRYELDCVQNALAHGQDGSIAEALHSMANVLQTLLAQGAADAEVMAAGKETLLWAAGAMVNSVQSFGLSPIEAVIATLRTYGDVQRVLEIVPPIHEGMMQLRDALETELEPDPEVLEWIALLDRCLELMDNVLNGQDVAQALIAALTQVLDMQRKLEQRVARQGKTPCVRCGHDNPTGQRHCESCGAVMLSTGNLEPTSTFETSDAPDEGFVMTENIQRIVDAIDAYAEKRAPAAAFRAEVAWFEGLITEVRALEPPPKRDKAYTMFLNGLDRSTRGVDSLNRALAKDDPTLVTRGKKLILEGAAMVQRADRLSEQSS